MRKIRVALLYRVVQRWRIPIFKQLSIKPAIDLKVYYGNDFIGTKVISGKDLSGFKSQKLWTIKITKRNSRNLQKRQMPFCPTLFFHLLFGNPDVIITEGSSNFANAIQGFIYAKIFRKKIIWWGLGVLHNEIKVSLKDKFVQIIERRCDAHIVYSSRGQEYYRSIGVPLEKIFVAVNVVDTDRIKRIISSDKFAEIALHHNGFNILFVGELLKVKKVDMLIKAFSILESKYSDCFLNIVGKGPMYEELRGLSVQLGIKNIAFRGQVIDNIHEYFAISDIFVLPGLGGLAISEAMAYGLPVIASIGDGCEVDLIDESNGIIDINLNERSLAMYLEKIYNNKPLLQRMKQASLEKIDKSYNITEYVNMIYNAIRYVC